jgi:hypothetical protein
LSIVHQNTLRQKSSELRIEWLGLSIYHLKYIDLWLGCKLRDYLVLSKNILLSLSTVVNLIKIVVCVFLIPKSVKYLYSMDLS